MCVIPDSEATNLARQFGTRDSKTIIDGLGQLMQKKVTRVEKAMDGETPEKELKPEITKALKDVFDDGVKLAKLVDPKLSASGPKVQIGIVNGGVPGTPLPHGGANPEQQLVAKAIEELEASGVDRADIDGEMVAQYLANQNRDIIDVPAIEP